MKVIYAHKNDSITDKPKVINWYINVRYGLRENAETFIGVRFKKVPINYSTTFDQVFIGDSWPSECTEL